jgi:hypothetical protein
MQETDNNIINNKDNKQRFTVEFSEEEFTKLGEVAKHLKNSKGGAIRFMLSEFVKGMGFKDLNNINEGSEGG